MVVMFLPGGAASLVGFVRWPRRKSKIVPMFHVLGWGYSYTATILGSKQALVHGSLDSHRILDLIAQEEISFTAAVPTIWQGVRASVEAEPDRWNTPTLQRINCGASAPAPSLIRWYWEKLGVEMIQSWGMTETNPLGVIATPTPLLMAEGEATGPIA